MSFLSILDELQKPDLDQMEDPLKGYIQNKKPWVPFPMAPVEADPFTVADGSYEAIARCLALALALELPVGAYTLSGSTLMSHPSMAAALESNAKDEANHYRAFKIASVAYDMPLIFLDKMQEFQLEAEAIDVHPVLIAGFLELTVFFPSLAILRKYGSPTLKQLVNYVSRDEATHVRTNYHIADTLGLEWGSAYEEADDLRGRVMEWLVSSLADPGFWVKQSESLRDTRQAPGLDWTGKVGVVPKFFEMSRY